MRGEKETKTPTHIPIFPAVALRKKVYPGTIWIILGEIRQPRLQEMPCGPRCDLRGVRRETLIARGKRPIQERNGLVDVREVFYELVACEAVVLVDREVVRGDSVGQEHPIGVEQGEGAIGGCVVGESDLVRLRGLLDRV